MSLEVELSYQVEITQLRERQTEGLSQVVVVAILAQGTLSGCCDRAGLFPHTRAMDPQKSLAACPVSRRGERA